MPITVSIGMIISTLDKLFIPCWNLRKTAWSEYTKYFDDNINRIEPIPDNYIRFINLIKTSAKKSIPRGLRHNYTLYWTKECEELLKEYESDGNEINVNKLIVLLDEECRNRLIQAMDEMDFTYSSRESWSLVKKLGAGQTSWKACKVLPNSISTINHNTTNIKFKKPKKMKVKADYKEVLKICAEKSENINDFGVEKVKATIKLLKNGKAADIDGILPEFLKYLGTKGKFRLTRFFINKK